MSNLHQHAMSLMSGQFKQHDMEVGCLRGLASGLPLLYRDMQKIVDNSAAVQDADQLVSGCLHATARMTLHVQPLMQQGGFSIEYDASSTL